jgi:hypothetical protein
MTVMLRCCVLGAVLLLPVGVVPGAVLAGDQCYLKGEPVSCVNHAYDKRVGTMPIHEPFQIDATSIITVPNSCEERMREAMRAIAPFTHPTEYIVSENAVYESPGTRLRKEADRIERKDKAVQQFNETYRECVEGK